jgi:multicomponent Na+:H+ antiporter subunit E
VAVPTVLAAAALAGAVVPWPRRIVRPRPLLRFAGWFVEQSLRGGLEAARLALAPSMPLSPALRELTTRLPEGGARVLLAQAVSLTPGTLTVDLEGDRLLLHVLDGGEGLERDVRELEERIAELVGLPPGGAA